MEAPNYISIENARAAGRRKYGPEVCTRGHLADRYVSNPKVCTDCQREQRGRAPIGKRATPKQISLLALVTRQHRSEITRLTRLQTKLTDLKNSSELRFIELCRAIQRDDK